MPRPAAAGSAARATSPTCPFPSSARGRSFPRVIFKDIKGFPSRNYGVPWQNMPATVELSEPYLLGLTSNGVEVRTADKVSRMVQLVDLPKATHMCKGNSIFVVSPSSCWVLQPVPVSVQVDSLVALEDFAAASKLAVGMGWLSTGGAHGPRPQPCSPTSDALRVPHHSPSASPLPPLF